MVSNAIRWSGVAGLIGGLLFVVGMPSAAEVLPIIPHVVGHWLFGLAALLSLICLIGLSTQDGVRANLLGKIGLAISGIGTLLIFIGNGAEAILQVHQSFSWTSQLYSLGLLGTIIGLILLGIAALRRKTLPRWLALSLVILPPSFFAAFVIVATILVTTGNTSQSAADRK